MFYGRNYYINLLEELLKKPISSVVTCRGRRRIGKSTLFEEFARRNGCRFLKLEGRAPGEGVGDREQREAFGIQPTSRTWTSRDSLQAIAGSIRRPGRRPFRFATASRTATRIST